MRAIYSRAEAKQTHNPCPRVKLFTKQMNEQAIRFETRAREGEARTGILRTRRATIETPVFMPVGTAGTVKGTRFEALEAEDLDAHIILGNTYHLWLRPGAEIIRA